MNTFFTKYAGYFIYLILAVSTVGCQVATRQIEPDEVIHYDEGYDFSDKKAIVESLANSLLAKPPLVGNYDRPTIIVYGVANKTDEHISTDGITDDIRQRLVASGKARLINETQRDNISKEMGYQYSKAVAPETRRQRAKQIGAKYMLTGTLRSIDKEQPRQMRLSKKTLKYYSLNLELTDIETSLIEWADSVEVIREASKPFIGW